MEIATFQSPPPTENPKPAHFHRFRNGIKIPTTQKITKINIDFRKYLIKNYHSPKLEFSVSSRHIPVKRLLKRQSKYLKDLKVIWRDSKREMQSLKQAKHIKRLVLYEEVLKDGEFRSTRTKERKLGEYLSQVNNFSQLKDLSLIFPKDGDRSGLGGTLYQALKNIRRLSDLSSLTVRNFPCIARESQNKKKCVLRSFRRVKKLELSLNFNNVFYASRYPFSFAMPLPELESLDIGVSNCFVVNSEEFARFVGSHVKLRRLNIEFDKFIFDDYQALLEKIQGLENLETLVIKQKRSDLPFVSAKMIDETVLKLGRLKKVEISVGKDGEDLL